jgi:lipopolysaccharide transport protein LptA
MRKLAAFTLLALFMAAHQLLGQTVVSPLPSTTTGAKKEEKKEKGSKEKAASEKSATEKLLGSSAGTQPNGPVTTEIYADEAFFDSNKNIGIFSGHVKVTDPRFNLQSEKLTVFISKGENQGLEKAIAEGDVAMVRDRPDPNGGPPTRAVGRSDKATYVSVTGNVELTGTPRVQEGLNTHIATSSGTVMVVNQSGQLTTHGPSRTEIRQEPKDEAKREGKPETKPAASPNP